MIRKLPTSTRVVWLGILCVAFFLAATGYASPEAVDATAHEGGSSGGLLLVAALAAMIVLGSPLFVIIGVLAAMCFMIYGEGYDIGPCLTLDTKSTICNFGVFPDKMADLAGKPVLLAIPFFVVSGAIMSAGDIANRLVNFARGLVGFLPGGLAIATVGGCIFFAAISGSSPVTVIAIGSMMYPALVKAGYKDRFSMGLVTTAGSLGILIPPSIPMLVFAIVASAEKPLNVGQLFMAGIVPGFMIGWILSVYSVFVASKSLPQALRAAGLLHGGALVYFLAMYLLSMVLPTWVLFVAHVIAALAYLMIKQRQAFWAVMLPVVILGGIYSGRFTATEAAAVSVIYALIVELFIHGELKLRDIPKILSEAAVMMGTLLIIMALAFGLNDFLVEEKIPDAAVEWIQSLNLSVLGFLLIMNLFLLVVGALMDSISAILVIAPLLTPIAIGLGIDPIHLGVIFIVNLEIGYLTPPIGINLFVASAAFNKPMGDVIRSVVPFILLMFVGLGIVTYVPSVALGPVNVLLRNKDFYEPLPTGPKETKAVAVADSGLGGPPPDEDENVRSFKDINAITSQLLSMCSLSGKVLKDKEVKPEDRLKVFEAKLSEKEITNETVLELLKPALAEAGKPETFKTLQTQATKLLNQTYECSSLERLLGPDGLKVLPEDEAEGGGGDDYY